jgi:16S rRNA (uracil1498-N3)-methyltransferase
MNQFYCSTIHQGIHQIKDEELRHLNVLRKKIGDEITIIDGAGGCYQAKINNITKQVCTFDILSKKTYQKNTKKQLHIAIAPTKNIDRIEWFVEKATEIGIQEISFVICKNAERKTIKTDRLSKIVLSATKQSLQYFLPKINEPVTFSDFIKQSTDGQKYIGYCDEQHEKKTLSNVFQTQQPVTILIGPEGDFTPNEIHLALQHHYKIISLGETRLRTETAGVVACTLINTLNL